MMEFSQAEPHSYEFSALAFQFSQILSIFRMSLQTQQSMPFIAEQWRQDTVETSPPSNQKSTLGIGYARTAFHCLRMKEKLIENQHGKAAKWMEKSSFIISLANWSLSSINVHPCAWWRQKSFNEGHVQFGNEFSKISNADFSLNSPSYSKIWIAHDSLWSPLWFGNVSFRFHQALGRIRIWMKLCPVFPFSTVLSLLLQSSFFSFFPFQTFYPTLLLFANWPNLSFLFLNCLPHLHLLQSKHF